MVFLEVGESVGAGNSSSQTPDELNSAEAALNAEPHQRLRYELVGSYDFPVADLVGSSELEGEQQQQQQQHGSLIRDGRAEAAISDASVAGLRNLHPGSAAHQQAMAVVDVVFSVAEDGALSVSVVEARGDEKAGSKKIYSSTSAASSRMHLILGIYLALMVLIYFGAKIFLFPTVGVVPEGERGSHDTMRVQADSVIMDVGDEF